MIKKMINYQTEEKGFGDGRYVLNLPRKELYNFLKEQLPKDCVYETFEEFLNNLQIEEYEDDCLEEVGLTYTKKDNNGSCSISMVDDFIYISVKGYKFCELKKGNDKESLFAEYIKNGGLPYITMLGNDSDKIDTYLEGIYNTIIIKDVEERQRRKESDPNKRKITDITLLKNISKFLASSIGNPISIKSISDFVTSNGRKISQNTVDDYVDALIEPYIFYPAERFDVLGKQLLKKNQKMYIVDLGLRRHLLPRARYDLGFSLENVIYFELLRRGYSVNIGKVGVTEIDFVARKNEEIHYYQVTASMLEETTFEREMAPFKSITDNYPKTVITLDRFTLGNYDGIEVVNAIDWLLKK